MVTESSPRRLGRAVQQVRQRLAVAGGRFRPETREFDENGLLLPTKYMRRLVSGYDDAETWLRSGKGDASFIAELLSDSGSPLEGRTAILDFGCGCGRVGRWWTQLSGPAVFGCDYDKRLVSWCAKHLPHMTLRTNDPGPPLPYGPAEFDLVYAISLLTHLTEQAQDAWMRDVARVLTPGGLFLFTVHGERFAAKMTPDELAGFNRGELVVRSPEIVGEQGCAAFHPPAYVRERISASGDFELVGSVHDGARSTAMEAVTTFQDTYLVRRL
jgi:SAM-dependent methyltransferase